MFEKIIHGQRWRNLFYDERCRDYTNIAAEDMVFFYQREGSEEGGLQEIEDVPLTPKAFAKHLACLKKSVLEVSTTCDSGWVRSRAATAQSPR